MKNISVIIACFFSAVMLQLNAQTGSYKLKFDSLSCLQIEGKILNANEGSNNECLVELISENEVREAITLKEGKNKFKFVLSKNTFYSIRVSKAGFATKLISVNTEMLTQAEGVHIFRFETGLIKDKVAARLNQDILDFPVTIIHFDYEKESFVHNSAYTAYIKKELYKPNPAKIQIPKPIYVSNTNDLASNSK